MNKLTGKFNRMEQEKLMSCFLYGVCKNEKEFEECTRIYDSIHFEIGVLIEFQLFKNKCGWEKGTKHDIQAVLDRKNGITADMTKEKETLLNMLFEARMDGALEEQLRKNERY